LADLYDDPAIQEKFDRYGPSYRWLVTAAGLTGAIAMILSATIVNVAVPSIMGAYGIGQDGPRRHFFPQWSPVSC
jgi:hypothetical protein